MKGCPGNVPEQMKHNAREEIPTKDRGHQPDARGLLPIDSVSSHRVHSREKSIRGILVTARNRKADRDTEKGYPAGRFADKLRRLADCIEQGKKFRIQIAGERVSVPPDAVFTIEHEREDGKEEVEFQLKWTVS